MTAFILACIFIELTPGPNMAYLALLSISEGKRAGFSTVAGIATGLLIIALASAFGMAALVVEQPVIYQFIRWTGVFYLLWLAFESWRKEAEVSPARLERNYHVRYFKRGLLVNLLNPKAAIFYLTVLPGFIDIRYDILPQVILMTLISISIATLVHGLIVVFANRLKPYVNDYRKRQWMRKIFAVLLAVVAAWFAVSTG